MICSYFQISMKRLGFSTVKANLLSVPNTVWSMFNLILLTAATEVFQNRWFLCSLENWWWLAPFIALIALPDPISPWTYFALATVILSFPVRLRNPKFCRARTDEPWRPTVRTRGASRLGISQCGLCSYSHRLGLSLQHGGTDVEHHRSQQCVPSVLDLVFFVFLPC